MLSQSGLVWIFELFFSIKSSVSVKKNSEFSEQQVDSRTSISSFVDWKMNLQLVFFSSGDNGLNGFSS